MMAHDGLHATAIMLDGNGLIIVGSSGSGKSTLALRLIAEARREGRLAALIADDYVLIAHEGDNLVARSTGRLEGMIEIRGSGIGVLPFIPQARLVAAIAPVVVTGHNRLPPDNAVWTAPGGITLPLVTIDRSHPDPLAVLDALAAASSTKV